MAMSLDDEVKMPGTSCHDGQHCKLKRQKINQRKRNNARENRAATKRMEAVVDLDVAPATPPVAVVDLDMAPVTLPGGDG